METLINKKLRSNISVLIKLQNDIWNVIISPLTASNYQLIMGKNYDEAYLVILQQLTPLRKNAQVNEHILQHLAVRNEIKKLNNMLERHQSISPVMQNFFKN